ncbi:MAG: accessory Sec system translocase SecA2 [Clostridia bacterium]
MDFSKNETKELKKIVENAVETANYPKAYAALREVFFRLFGVKLFENQIAAAYSMQLGRVAEVPTGEGKTFSAAILAVVFAIQKKHVHILVFNDYLAKRDYNWTLKIFEFFSIDTAYITEDTVKAARKKSYEKLVVYLSAKEAGFDYLRDFLVNNVFDRVFPEFDVAIVDEADSILIDESRIPLVLAGEIEKRIKEPLVRVNAAMENLNEKDYIVKREANQAWLTDEGILHMEKLLGVENLYTEENAELLSLTEASLRAHRLLSRDKDYIVREGSIEVIDESTGRVVLTRKFPDLLHDAVEAKEGVIKDRTTKIYNSMTMQAFLLHYPHLSGMTGTMTTASDVLFDLYELELDVIPPHTPCIRKDRDCRVFETEPEKREAIIALIEEANRKGQPVLLGTESVSESEAYSRELQNRDVSHNVLNAKNDEIEAELIAHAGELYAVTVSTNMAGRGVDIKLGGNDESAGARVAELSGLLVLSTTLNRSRRIDNQLRGRAGRQGDPGESQFFASLDDELLLIYSEEIENLKKRGKHPTDKQMYNYAIWSQKEAEGQDALSRTSLERYSYILEQQRTIITGRRDAILIGEHKDSVLLKYDFEFYDELISRVGESAILKAESQLLLYYINLRWSDYTETMEQTRQSIHLSVVGGENPLAVYNQTAIDAYSDMESDIINDVVDAMHKYPISEDGIDMEKNDLVNRGATWTYMQDDSSSQFSRLPFLIKTTKNAIKGTVFTLKDIFRKKD